MVGATGEMMVLVLVTNFMVDECTELVSVGTLATESAHVLLLLVLLVKHIGCFILLLSDIVFLRNIHGLALLREIFAGH